MLTLTDKDFSIAIVGGGPAGFFTAEALLKKFPAAKVSIFEKLPAPYGLVRYGVAPDHQGIKKVANKFSTVGMSPSFRYYGHVVVGQDISLQELQSFYSVVILAYGALVDKRLNIPGESLINSAMDFVSWVNGNLLYENPFSLQHENIAIIGHGNVALDIARILVKPIDDLRTTDIPEHVLDILAESKVKNIYLIGRRGPAQVAFTYNEIKELANLPSCNMAIEDLFLDKTSMQELDLPAFRQKKRMYDLLKQLQNRSAKVAKTIFFRFLYSPTACKEKSHSLEHLVLEKNMLVGPPGRQKSQGTGKHIELPCSLCFRSIGYTAEKIDNIPYDQGTVSHRDGRVLLNGKSNQGLYAVGWCKRGSNGLLGHDKRDATSIAKVVEEDVPHLVEKIDPENEIQKILKKRRVRTISFQDWMKIDALEQVIGKAKGKIREKFLSMEEMYSHLEK